MATPAAVASAATKDLKTGSDAPTTNTNVTPEPSITLDMGAKDKIPTSVMEMPDGKRYAATAYHSSEFNPEPFIIQIMFDSAAEANKKLPLIKILMQEQIAFFEYFSKIIAKSGAEPDVTLMYSKTLDRFAFTTVFNGKRIVRAGIILSNGKTLHITNPEIALNVNLQSIIKGLTTAVVAELGKRAAAKTAADEALSTNDPLSTDDLLSLSTDVESATTAAGSAASPVKVMFSQAGTNAAEGSARVQSPSVEGQSSNSAVQSPANESAAQPEGSTPSSEGQPSPKAKAKK